MTSPAPRCFRSAVAGGVALAPLALMLVAAPAAAQVVGTPPTDNAASQGTTVPATPTAVAESGPTNAAPGSGDIVVTGSRIVRADLQASSPVATISGEALKTNNAVTVEQILQVNPQFQPGENSSENNPGLGVATVDLRGLGSNRTLVLIDGKRAPFFDTTGAVDVNTIPTALIKRVDILTGGASAVYGSDAVAGVVNFVLDDRFTGIRADGSAQIGDKGYAPLYDAALTAGVKLGDRGNIVVSGNYSKRDGVFYGDLPDEATSLDSSTLGFSGSSNTYPTAFDIPGAGRQQVQPNGTLSSTVQGYNTNATNYAVTPLERYSVMGLARYEIGHGIELYGRGSYSHVDVNTQLAPTATAGFTFDLHPDNPLLTPAERNAFFNVAANPKLQINPDGTSTIGIRRRIIETGGRLEEHVTNSWQIVGGVRGDITSTLHFDVSGQYGKVTRNEVFQNDLSYNAVSDAIDAVAGPNGSVVCRSGNAGCVPFNLFGYTGITPQSLAYVERNASQHTESTQLIADASVSGDIGFLQSPFADAPAAFSVGGEYRRERAATLVDPLFASGDLIYYGQGQSVAGSFNVKEGFAELKIPLVQNRPGIYALDLETGARYSDYSTVGGVWTYKAGADYAPFDGLRFRGIYNRTVRAPNIYELYSPLVSATTSIASDPCAGANVAATSVVGQICTSQIVAGQRAAGRAANQAAAAGLVGSIPTPIQGQINGFFAGNANLNPEYTDTYTAGVVFNPRGARALAISLDYYNIKINNAVSVVQANDVVNQCYNIDRNAASPACSGIVRNYVDGSLSGNITNGVPVIFGNLAVIKTDGLDLTAGYHGTVGGFDYAFAYGGNYIFSYKKQTSPNSIAYECSNRFGADCGLQPMPKYKHTVSFSFGVPQLSLTTRWRLIGAVRQDMDTMILKSHIPAYNYFDETATFTIDKRFSLRLGIQNLTDKRPPIVGDTVGDTTNFGSTYPGVYDVIGRTFFAGFSVKY